MSYKVIPVEYFDDFGTCFRVVPKKTEYKKASEALNARSQTLSAFNFFMDNGRGWRKMLNNCAESKGDPEYEALVIQIIDACKENGYLVEVLYDVEP